MDFDPALEGPNKNIQGCPKQHRPNMGKEVSIIEKPQIALLINEATYASIYQHEFFLQMQANPQPKQATKSLGQPVQGQQLQTK